MSAPANRNFWDNLIAILKNTRELIEYFFKKFFVGSMGAHIFK
jgi:hypothetical protein